MSVSRLSVASPLKPLFAYDKYWAECFGAAPFLPMSRAEMDILGWDSCDIILVTVDVDYNIKLQLSKDAVSDNVAQYPFPIRCKGNISKPASLCNVDSRAVRDIATNALLNSEKAQKLKAELEAKKTEAQAKAQEKLNEALQKNGVKLGEEGQKAADQLNKQLGDKIGNQLNKLFKRE